MLDQSRLPWMAIAFLQTLSNIILLTELHRLSQVLDSLTCALSLEWNHELQRIRLEGPSCDLQGDEHLLTCA